MLKHILFIEKPPSMTADLYRMVPFFCRHSVEECTAVSVLKQSSFFLKPQQQQQLSQDEPSIR